MLTIIESFGFELDRTKGSHQIYKHPEISQAFLTLQPTNNNQAKPYQIKQFLRLVEEYNLTMGGEDETSEEGDETEETDS